MATNFGKALDPLTQGLFGKAPDPTTVPLDSDTQGLINESTNRALQPQSTFNDSINQNVDMGRSLDQDQQHAHQEDVGMGGDSGMNQALRNQYSSRASTAINKIKARNDMEAQMQRANYMKQVSMAAMGQQRAAVQNYQMLTDAYNQSEMARAQFVNSLFQTANVGMAINSGRTKPSGFESEMNAASTSNIQSPRNLGGYAPDGISYGASPSNIV